MKRKIKFRAWDKRSKIMRSVDFINFKNNIVGYNEGYGGIEASSNFDDAVIMQYTGLKGRNGEGKEIYEGDVVYLAGYGDYVVEFPFIQLYESAYEKDIGSIKGNIYENPELIEKELK